MLWEDFTRAYSSWLAYSVADLQAARDSQEDACLNGRIMHNLNGCSGISVDNLLCAELFSFHRIEAHVVDV